MPRITVIIPVLNGMPYLVQALGSLYEQTLRDFDVVLWDNGSVDSTLVIAREWIPSRLPGRVISGRPAPLHESLAVMVEEARTEYCARFDADDICLPFRFKQQLELLERDQTVAIVGGQCPMITANGDPADAADLLPCRSDDIVTQMLFRSALTHPALMFRRRAILDSGNYQHPKPVEDLDLYLRVIQRFNCYNLPEAVLKYRLHASSVSHQQRELQQEQAVDCVAAYSHEVYGLSSDTYRRLRHKRSRCSIRHLIQSARYRADGNKGRLRNIVFSQTFVDIGRCLTDRRDFLSKATFRAIERCL